MAASLHGKCRVRSQTNHVHVTVMNQEADILIDLAPFSSRQTTITVIVNWPIFSPPCRHWYCQRYVPSIRCASLLVDVYIVAAPNPDKLTMTTTDVSAIRLGHPLSRLSS